MDANRHVGKLAHALLMVPAVKSIAGKLITIPIIGLDFGYYNLYWSSFAESFHLYFNFPILSCVLSFLLPFVAKQMSKELQESIQRLSLCEESVS